MKIYILSWDNGEQYDEHDVEVLGYFTSPDRLNLAIKKVQASASKYTIKGELSTEEVEADVVIPNMPAPDSRVPFAQGYSNWNQDNPYPGGTVQHDNWNEGQKIRKAELR